MCPEEVALCRKTIICTFYPVCTVKWFCKNIILMLQKKSVPNRKKNRISNLLEKKAITHSKPCVAQEMTHNLLVPCVYIFNKPRKWTLTCFFYQNWVKRWCDKNVPGAKKKLAYFLYSKFCELFFILNRASCQKWFYFLLVPSVDMIDTKNGEDIFIKNAILGQITGVTKMSPALYQIR